MDPVWQSLPCDLIEYICNFLDPGTRRDLGFKPQKLKSLPNLNLHSKNVFYYSTCTVIPILKGDIWTDFVFDVTSISVTRCLRAPFMVVEGVQVYKSEYLSQKYHHRA